MSDATNGLTDNAPEGSKDTVAVRVAQDSIAEAKRNLGITTDPTFSLDIAVQEFFVLVKGSLLAAWDNPASSDPGYLEVMRLLQEDRLKTELVLAVPSHYNVNARIQMCRLAESAGFDEVEVENETICALASLDVQNIKVIAPSYRQA